MVLLFDFESETSFFFRQWAPREGLGLSLSDDMLPLDFNAVEDVDEAVVIGKAEGDGGGVEGAGEAEAATTVGCGGSGDGGSEVELGGVVKLVGVDTVDLGDVVVAVVGEGVEEAGEELKECEAEFRGEECVEECLAQGPHAHERGQRRPVLLHLLGVVPVVKCYSTILLYASIKGRYRERVMTVELREEDCLCCGRLWG